MHRGATEAGTGHGEDTVIERLPALFGSSGQKIREQNGQDAGRKPENALNVPGLSLNLTEALISHYQN
jgi:hypothetical protein